jgi:hypothetical protein
VADGAVGEVRQELFAAALAIGLALGGTGLLIGGRLLGEVLLAVTDVASV